VSNVESAEDFDNVNQLAAAADWRLIFDLNVLLRDRDNRWNSTNAKELLRYAVKKKYDKNMDLELGNGEQELVVIQFILYTAVFFLQAVVYAFGCQLAV